MKFITDEKRFSTSIRKCKIYFVLILDTRGNFFLITIRNILTTHSNTQTRIVLLQNIMSLHNEVPCKYSSVQLLSFHSFNFIFQLIEVLVSTSHVYIKKKTAAKVSTSGTFLPLIPVCIQWGNMKKNFSMESQKNRFRSFFLMYLPYIHPYTIRTKRAYNIVWNGLFIQISRHIWACNVVLTQNLTYVRTCFVYC